MKSKPAGGPSPHGPTRRCCFVYRRRSCGPRKEPILSDTSGPAGSRRPELALLHVERSACTIPTTAARSRSSAIFRFSENREPRTENREPRTFSAPVKWNALGHAGCPGTRSRPGPGGRRAGHQPPSRSSVRRPASGCGCGAAGGRRARPRARRRGRAGPHADQNDNILSCLQNTPIDNLL